LELPVANNEDLKRLRLGVSAWNSWRDQHAEELPGLDKADLRDCALGHANLRGANFSEAILEGADLEFADLSDALLRGAKLCGARLGLANLRAAILFDADLHEANLDSVNLSFARLGDANLSGANLRGANLRGAFLRSANLRGADLSFANLDNAALYEADFSDANLSGANLSHALLNGSILTGAKLFDTVFADADLTAVVGLDSCDHRGPSFVDFRTIAEYGLLPIAFLRGVGLPDPLIDDLPSLLKLPYHSCFISYSHRDEEFAQRLYADLQNSGVRCWMAHDDLRIGSNFLDEIDAAIRRRDKLVLVLTEQSIGSDWVKDEVNIAFELEREREQTVLFPVRLDDFILETREPWAKKLRHRHIGDFRQWRSQDQYRKTFRRVLRDLKTKRKLKSDAAGKSSPSRSGARADGS